MNANQPSRWIVAVGVVIILALAGGGLAVSLGRAQAPEPPRGLQSPELPQVTSNFIPVQGRLTDASGIPLDGDYQLTFRLYDTSSSVTALCEDTRVATVEQGLFQTYMLATGCSIDGRQLYLGIEVGEDGEMSPRRYIDNVPYAWSLRPGALISGTLGNNAIVDIENWGIEGRGLRAYAMAESGENYGVVGASRSPDGFGGYFYNNSADGAALKAGGTGIIQSVAPSYLWISGNGVRPYNQNDSTIIDMNNHGGADIRRGATIGSKNVMLPITIPGTLYGQEAKITALDLYWSGETQFDAITAILLRRQTGVCTESECFESLLHDSATHTCDNDVEPTGCTLHFDLNTNNVLSANSGVLYLTIELAFNGEASPIDFGGARLTLEYNP